MTTGTPGTAWVPSSSTLPSSAHSWACQEQAGAAEYALSTRSPMDKAILRLPWRNLHCKHADPSVLAAVLRDTDHVDRHDDCNSCLTIALTANITYRTATNTYGPQSMLDPCVLRGRLHRKTFAQYHALRLQKRSPCLVGLLTTLHEYRLSNC